MRDTRQRMLSVEDMLDPNNMLESITYNRQRFASVPREDNLLGSLMMSHNFADNISIHSAHSDELYNTIDGLDEVIEVVVVCVWGGVVEGEGCEEGRVLFFMAVKCTKSNLG